MLAMAELEIRKEELAIKQSIIDKSFDKALENLKAMDGAKYEELIDYLFKNNADINNAEVSVSSNDVKKFNINLLNKINKKYGLNLKLSDSTCNIQGGFILKSEGVEINNSFETLIRMERDNTETIIADILFKG